MAFKVQSYLHHHLIHLIALDLLLPLHHYHFHLSLLIHHLLANLHQITNNFDNAAFVIEFSSNHHLPLHFHFIDRNIAITTFVDILAIVMMSYFEIDFRSPGIATIDHLDNFHSNNFNLRFHSFQASHLLHPRHHLPFDHFMISFHYHIDHLRPPNVDFSNIPVENHHSRRMNYHFLCPP